MQSNSTYKILIVGLIILAFLVGCQTSIPTQTDSSDQEAIFGDAKIDQAIPSVASSNVALEAEVQRSPALADASEDALLETESFTETEITAQAVLNEAVGFVVYSYNNPSLVNPWRVYKFDQSNNTKLLVYSGVREIQSVGISSDGNTLAFSMREKTEPNSDFEIFTLTISNKTIKRLTSNDFDDTNVSISANAKIVVWEGHNTLSNVRAITWRDYNTDPATDKQLSSDKNDVQPAVRATGEDVVFVRKHTDGSTEIMTYIIDPSPFIFNGSRLASRRLSSNIQEHPSFNASQYTNKIVWLEHLPGKDVVYFRAFGNSSNSLTVLASSTTGIEHPYLTSDGFKLVYGMKRNGVWNLYTKDLFTKKIVLATYSSSPINSVGAVWQLPQKAIDLTLEVDSKTYNQQGSEYVANDTSGSCYAYSNRRGYYKNLTVYRPQPDGSVRNCAGALPPAPPPYSRASNFFQKGQLTAQAASVYEPYRELRSTKAVFDDYAASGTLGYASELQQQGDAAYQFITLAAGSYALDAGYVAHSNNWLESSRTNPEWTPFYRTLDDGIQGWPQIDITEGRWVSVWVLNKFRCDCTRDINGPVGGVVIIWEYETNEIDPQTGKYKLARYTETIGTNILDDMYASHSFSLLANDAAKVYGGFWNASYLVRFDGYHDENQFSETVFHQAFTNPNVAYPQQTCSPSPYPFTGVYNVPPIHIDCIDESRVNISINP
jgi:hypothetical protein